jgi:hypothetical protein
MNPEPEDGERLDLSPFDPAADDQALERLVVRIRTAATPELLRRQRSRSVEGWLVGMRWPILAASTMLALVSVLALLTRQVPASAQSDAVAAGLGIPSACASWAYAVDRPSMGELLEGKGDKR